MATARWHSSRPFEQRLCRLEHRPPRQDPREIVRLLKDNGFDLIVSSATNGSSEAFFPSKIYPAHPQMEPEYIPRLLELCHENDIMVVSWVCFNVQDLRDPALMSRYQPANVFPQWTQKYIDDPTRNDGPAVGMCVLSSPWPQKQAEFFTEIMGLGFDGLWVDGMFPLGLPGRQVGCVCDYCRERFHRDTGLNLPQRIEWNDAAFRTWVTWRYDRLVDTANFYAEKVHEAYPDCPITFNCNAWPWGWANWERGIPLRPYPNFIASLHTGLYPTNGIQIHPLIARITRAMNPKMADMWQPIFSTRHALWTREIPPHEPTLRYHALTCIADGIIPWYGGTSEDMRVFQTVNAATARRRPYFGGEDVPFGAIVVSDRTKDFYGERDDAHRALCLHDVHGASAMLAQHQILHQVIFDDHLERGDIGRFKVIVLSNIACLSDRALDNLRGFVEAGGTVIATFETGRYDAWGQPRAEGLSLFGAQVTEVVGIDTDHTYRPLDLLRPEWNERGTSRVAFSGPFVRFTLLDGWEVRATAVGPGAAVSGEPAIIERRIGRGRVVFFGDDLGAAYFRWPYAETRRILAHVINSAGPPIEVSAPTVVLANALLHRESSELLVHLVNLPPATNRMGHPDARSTVDDVVPVHDIRIVVHDFAVQSARAGIANHALPLESTDGRASVVVPRVDDHEVVVFRLTR